MEKDTKAHDIFPRLSRTEVRHLSQVLDDLRSRRDIRFNIAAKALERTIHKVEMLDGRHFERLLETAVTTPASVRAYDKIRKAIDRRKKLEKR